MEFFNCRKCNSKYESHSYFDGRSKELEKYIRFMGYCDMNCWNKLDDGEKNEDLMHTYIYGDSRKRNYSPFKRLKIQAR